MILLFSGSGATNTRAQGAPAAPTPTVAPTPIADDKQNVRPEDLRGVPDVVPGYESNDRRLPDLGRVGVDMMNQKTLTLRGAITKALENNNDIEITRENVKSAEFDLQAARGVYEPRLSGQTFYERATVPNVSIFSRNTKTTQNSLAGNAGIEWFVPKFGTVFNGAFNNQRVSTDNPLSILSPQYNSSLVFSIAQPIFRGRKFDQNRRTIEISKRNLSLTDAQFRQRTIEVIAGIERAYWDLTYALRNLQVQRDSVRDAKEQLEHNRRLVKEGQLAPIDVIAADTQAANFEQAVYDALNQVTVAENNLKNLISPDRADSIWSASIVPVDPVDSDAPATTLPEALAAALENRPEIELNEVQKDINRIDQRFYREESKPQVDFAASYTFAGIAGSQNPNLRNPFTNDGGSAPPVTVARDLTGGFTSATSDILLNRYPTFRVGVNLNLPLSGNKTAKAQLGKSLVDAERLNTQRRQLEQNIQVEVRNALQNVRTAEARRRSASIARENSEKQYESERRKLDAGQSDIYKVLDRQTALTTARSNELRAQTELNKAIADLARATGNSLKANHIEEKLKK